MGDCSHSKVVDYIKQSSNGTTTTYYKCGKCQEPMGSSTS